MTRLSLLSRQKTVLLLALLFSSSGTVAGQSSGTILDTILQSHGRWPVIPETIEMTGMSTRGNVAEPFRLVATRDEKLSIEYGDLSHRTKRVATPGYSFLDDGQKATYSKTPNDFTQLDVTSVFLVAQLTQRATFINPGTEWTVIGGIRARPFRIESARHVLHRGVARVEDRADLYVAENGMLVGLVRNFYDKRPEQYTVSFAYSDYRRTGGVLLPYGIDVFVNGKRTQTFRVETYQINVPVEKQLFQERRPR